MDKEFLEKGVSAMLRLEGPCAGDGRGRMVGLVGSGRRPDHLAREFEVSARSIRDGLVEAETGTMIIGRAGSRAAGAGSFGACGVRSVSARRVGDRGKRTAWIGGETGPKGVFGFVRAPQAEFRLSPWTGCWASPRAGLRGSGDGAWRGCCRMTVCCGGWGRFIGGAGGTPPIGQPRDEREIEVDEESLRQAGALGAGVEHRRLEST